MNLLRSLVKNTVHKIGFDLHRLTPSSNPAFQLLKALNRFDVDLVLDVGANVGQFASELRSVGYKGNLVSFEPLSAAHNTLTVAARRDSMWQVHRAVPLAIMMAKSRLTSRVTLFLPPCCP